MADMNDSLEANQRFAAISRSKTAIAQGYLKSHIQSSLILTLHNFNNGSSMLTE
jgi:hypothetical protein